MRGRTEKGRWGEVAQAQHETQGMSDYRGAKLAINYLFSGRKVREFPDLSRDRLEPYVQDTATFNGILFMPCYGLRTPRQIAIVLLPDWLQPLPGLPAVFLRRTKYVFFIHAAINETATMALSGSATPPPPVGWRLRRRRQGGRFKSST
ncbi:hypothetical protein GUJ93_ZPchr0006g46132 [Zizania palustris]|uniref:Uncharacterized protein n=1 Tax=Zizania palustris TaxID=103762 RepID=A0A8J5SKW2_ZIZPA|nr:hypothetical protein GUJ93_ZPchr0006g46132 [Zizania palustris]